MIFVFLGENLVSWNVSQSSVESEYRAMVNVTLELICNRDLLIEIDSPQIVP